MKTSVKIVLLGFFIFAYLQDVHSQMPTNGNYSNWDWENNDQENWKRKDGNNPWREIRLAFAPSTEKAGLMVEIYGTKDFTKAKGWKLLFADFGGEYPYFALYNPHKSIIRTYMYTEGNPIYSHILVTLQNNNEKFRVLSLADDGVHAIDSDEKNSSDILTCIIPSIGLNSWAVGEFPVLFDPKNVGGATYNWTLSFYACDNFNIQMSLNGTLMPIDAQNLYTLSSSSNPVSGSTFNAGLTTFNTRAQSVEKLIENMHKSADKILENNNNETFLKDYANLVKSVKNYTDIIHAVSSASSALSSIFGFARMFLGGTDPTKSTPPVAYIQQASLSGTLTIQRPLRSATLSVPGAFSYYPSNLPWQPYNCPVGILNLKKEPTIKLTTPYDRYAHATSKTALGNDTYIYSLDGYPSPLTIPKNINLSDNYPEKYPGRYIKYKFDEDIVIAKQEISGLTLKDIRFALVCKPTGTGTRKYKINTPYISCHNFFDLSGRLYAVPATNVVYKAIKEGKLIVHKYDETNDEIYFGTPYIPMNQFKGVTIEVPEDTGIQLAVLATFQSDKYDDLIIFKTVYNVKKNPNPETANSSKVFIDWEQLNFRYSDYYETTKYELNNSPNSSTYTGKQIILKPGFKGTNGFHATARDYKGNGNTIIDSYNYYCDNSLRSSLNEEWEEEVTDVDHVDSNLSLIEIYPNPCYGILFVKLPENVQSVRIEIYNLSGKKVKSYTDINNDSVLDVSSLSKGNYVFNIITANKVYSRKIVIN